MLYTSMLCLYNYVNVMLYTSMLCLYISMSRCIHQCSVEVNGISKAYKSVLYTVNRVLNVTNRFCLLYIFFLKSAIKKINYYTDKLNIKYLPEQKK